MTTQSKIATLKSAELTTKLREETFEIDGKEFSIRQLLAKERDAFMQEFRKRMEFQGETPIMKQFIGVQSDLLKRCLYETGKDKPMTEKEIQDMPAKVVQTIYEAAQELNGLTEESDKEMEAEAKND